MHGIATDMKKNRMLLILTRQAVFRVFNTLNEKDSFAVFRRNVHHVYVKENILLSIVK